MTADAVATRSETIMKSAPKTKPAMAAKSQPAAKVAAATRGYESASEAHCDFPYKLAPLSDQPTRILTDGNTALSIGTSPTIGSTGCRNALVRNG